ncbi:hypothetical protein [Luteimicrobium album]|uniref:hypothetical protein n=1 Tax=Luteimicrobium album TaxID=1054550 RepID=UPI0032AF4C18
MAPGDRPPAPDDGVPALPRTPGPGPGAGRVAGARRRRARGRPRPPAPTAWLGLALLAPLLYALVVLTASAHAGLREPPAVKLRLPVVLVVMHVAWGVGFLRGVSRHARTEHRT